MALRISGAVAWYDQAYADTDNRYRDQFPGNIKLSRCACGTQYQHLISGGTG